MKIHSKQRKVHVREWRYIYIKYGSQLTTQLANKILGIRTIIKGNNNARERVGRMVAVWLSKESTCRGRGIFKGDYRKKDSEEEEEEYQKEVIPKSCMPLRSYRASLLLVVRILLLLLMPSVCVPSSTCKLFLTVWPFTKNPCSLVLFPLLPFLPVTVHPSQGSTFENYKSIELPA